MVAFDPNVLYTDVSVPDANLDFHLRYVGSSSQCTLLRAVHIDSIFMIYALHHIFNVLCSERSLPSTSSHDVPACNIANPPLHDVHMPAAVRYVLQ